jgi:hypothetical protein
VGVPAPAAGQGIFERLGLDRMQLAALGAQVGRIDPTQVEAATVFAITADYGSVAPRWRLDFSASYWESRLSDDVVQTFLDSLRHSIDDPTGDYTLSGSRIPLYDVTLSVGLRWSPSPRTTLFRPYGGIGAAAHVINAEGRLIKGTFVERTLDNIAAGVFTSAGVELRPFRESCSTDRHAPIC